MIEVRVEALIDAPEPAVRRALGRADVWARTARTLGARMQLARLPDAVNLPSTPLRSGDVIRLRFDAPLDRLRPWRSAVLLRVDVEVDERDARDVGGGDARGVPLPRFSLLAGPAQRFQVTLFTEALSPAALSPEAQSPQAQSSEALSPEVQSPEAQSAEAQSPEAPSIARDVRDPAATQPRKAAPTRAIVECHGGLASRIPAARASRRLAHAARMFLGIATLAAIEPVVVVAGAVVHDGRLLVARRTRPSALAGCWELPGGKVEAGETERGALARELAEELDVAVDVGERIGPELAVGGGMLLHCYRVRITDGVPRAAETGHDEVRWIDADELAALPWLPQDRDLLPALRAAMADPRPL